MTITIVDLMNKAKRIQEKEFLMIDAKNNNTIVARVRPDKVIGIFTKKRFCELQ